MPLQLCNNRSMSLNIEATDLASPRFKICPYGFGSNVSSVITDSGIDGLRDIVASAYSSQARPCNLHVRMGSGTGLNRSLSNTDLSPDRLKVSTPWICLLLDPVYADFNLSNGHWSISQSVAQCDKRKKEFNVIGGCFSRHAHRSETPTSRVIPEKHRSLEALNCTQHRCEVSYIGCSQLQLERR